MVISKSIILLEFLIVKKAKSQKVYDVKKNFGKFFTKPYHRSKETRFEEVLIRLKNSGVLRSGPQAC